MQYFNKIRHQRNTYRALTKYKILLSGRNRFIGIDILFRMSFGFWRDFCPLFGVLRATVSAQSVIYFVVQFDIKTTRVSRVNSRWKL